jgi:hypothetical protein
MGMLISLFVATACCRRRRAASMASVAFSDVRCELSIISPCSPWVWALNHEMPKDPGSRGAGDTPRPQVSRLSTSLAQEDSAPPPRVGLGAPPADTRFTKPGTASSIASN